MFEWNSFSFHVWWNFALDCRLCIVECACVRLAVNGACDQCRTGWSGLFTITGTGRIRSALAGWRWCTNRLRFILQRWCWAANFTWRLVIQRIILRFWIIVRVDVAFFQFDLTQTTNVKLKWTEIMNISLWLSMKTSQTIIKSEKFHGEPTEISSSDPVFMDSNEFFTAAFSGKCVPGMSCTSNGSQKWSAKMYVQRTTRLMAQ